jgi:hypothetical protein
VQIYGNIIEKRKQIWQINSPVRIKWANTPIIAKKKRVLLAISQKRITFAAHY